MKKKNLVIVLCVLFLSLSQNIIAFSSGPFLSFNGSYGGSFTDPHLTREVLNDLNPLATSMTGTMSSMLIGGTIDWSYIFYDEGEGFMTSFGFLDGLGISATFGAEQGSAGQKISAREAGSGETFDIFMVVDYNPVLAVGGSLDFYFLDSIRVKIGGGTRIIADMNPEYLLYTTLDEESAAALKLQQQVGTIIVTEEMMSKFNAFMPYARLDVGYYVPVSETITLTFGAFGRYDWFRPMYLTMPQNLYDMVIDNGGNPDKAQPDYWLNSIDFGVTVSVSIKVGSNNNPYKQLYR